MNTNSRLRLGRLASAAIWVGSLLVPAAAACAESGQEPSGPKWVQRPDLAPLGMDIEDTTVNPVLLADDFACTQPGTLTNIVVWGSWLGDLLPGQDPGLVLFRLSIHADIPAGTQADWSMPGEPLWIGEFSPGTFSVRPEATGLSEGWYDPSTGLWLPQGDSICWRYEFPIDVTSAFVQTGTVANPIIYWLDVQAVPLEPGARFGWKTSESHWNDDACWVAAFDPYAGPWQELRYPPQHPYSPQSVDLAFALTGGPLPPLELDYGDAPDPGYPTLLASDGARHLLGSRVRLGMAVDSEGDGQPSLAADGDDTGGADDEDGVLVPAFIRRARSEALTVIVSAACKLNAWIDYNADGDWLDAGEQLFADAPLAAGTNALAFVVDPAAALGPTYARFRVSTAGSDGPAGLAADGEVEDYTLEILERFPPKMGLKWRQPPDLVSGLDLQSWTAPSIEPGVRVGPVVADDWWCDGRPIDAIRWWGSYVLYDGPTNELEGVRPIGFRLSWYVDIPAHAVGGDHSRPGRLLKQATFTLLGYGVRAEAADQVTETYVRTVPLGFLGPAFEGAAEHTFEYHVVLSEPWLEKHTFSRESYEPPCSSNVYWLSVEAVYQAPPAAGSSPWGWHTASPRFSWNDDAVVATNTLYGMLPWGELTYVPNVWPWSAATQHPCLGKSVNMAFALLSTVAGRRAAKWSQLPNMLLGTDLPSWRYADPQQQPPPWSALELRADDFVSDGRRITDVHWWGSYIGWQAQEFRDEFNPMPAPLGASERPLGFDLSWHAHDAAAQAPGALLTNVFIPIERCREVYYCTIPQIGHPSYPFEHEYQYYVDLADERFDSQPWYEEAGGHYWLNVQAVFSPDFVPAPPGEAGYNSPHEGWGWKIAGIGPDIRLDRSVVSNTPASKAWDPSVLPRWHPAAGALHDLAFELTTDRTDTNAVLRFTAIRRDTNSVVTAASVGTGGAGTQVLRRAAGGVDATVWTDIETNEAPFPPPSQNIWLDTVSPVSNGFYKVVEDGP